MRTPEAQAVAESAIRLMQGVVYEESDPDTWSALLNHRPHVRDHFATIGVDVVIDDAEGYAYLRSQEPDDVAAGRTVGGRSDVDVVVEG